MNIVLIGMMGSGKSTVGRLAAKKLQWEFYDSDRRIEEEEKMTISDIFEKKGEPAFRKIEERVVGNLIRENECVIAVGGGAPLSEENWRAFGINSTVLWLKVKPEILYKRLEHGGLKIRPLLKDSLSVERLSQILKDREPFYSRASLAIDTSGLEPEEAAEKVLELAIPKYK